MEFGIDRVGQGYVWRWPTQGFIQKFSVLPRTRIVLGFNKGRESFWSPIYDFLTEHMGVRWSDHLHSGGPMDLVRRILLTLNFATRTINRFDMLNWMVGISCYLWHAFHGPSSYSEMISPSYFSAFEESSFHQLGRTSIAILTLLQIRYLHKQTLKGTFGKPKNVYNEFSFSFINEKLCLASTHRKKLWCIFTVKIFSKLWKL